MPRKRAEAPPPSSPVTLHVTPSLAAAWDDVLASWFEKASNVALQGGEIVAVVIPTPMYGVLLRSLLLDHDISLVGIKFFTPALLRETLLRQLDIQIPLREHLRLLLSIAAHEGLQLPADQAGREARLQDPEFLAAKSVARAPDDFLRLFDQLGAAGSTFAEKEIPTLRPTVERFLRQVSACGFEMVHAADRKASQILPKQPPLFSSLLITGFNAAHWPLWPLLSTAARSSRETHVLLDYPRDAARALEETWIGTWEENFGTAEPVAEANTEPSQGFGDLIRAGAQTATTNKSVPILVGLNATEQAEAIVLITLRFLQEKSCKNLGILFPRAGAHSRLVSIRLKQAGIPHYDGLAHPAPGDFENAALQAWFDLQENQQLHSLLRFFEALPAASEFLGDLPLNRFSDRLRKAYREILIDDIAILREHCARKSNDEHGTQAAKHLATLKFLSARSTFARFLSETKTAFLQFKWKDAWAEVERLSTDWNSGVHAQLPRTIYLRWLREILNSFAKAREEIGDQPYARVRLLAYPEAEGHQWTHLILAGLNQGEWPPNESESGFLSDDDIDRINRGATRQGKQGEGHSTAIDGKTILLGSQQRRQLAVRQFVTALESTRVKVAMTASLLHESAPERVWNPSEFLSQAHFAATGKILSQETMTALREQTRTWLGAANVFDRTNIQSIDTAQTRTAYDARRQLAKAGEFEFSLRAPIERQITLRATQWDRVTKNPALIWMKVFLDIESDERSLNEWAASTGEWVHRWLAQISTVPGKNLFVDLVPSQTARERVRNAAKRARETVIELCFACGRTVPDWWLSGWANALALADCLALKIGDPGDWPRMTAEWVLDSPQIVSLGPDKSLRFLGRIDLILGKADADSKLSATNIWIVDYKTGNNKPLNAVGWKTEEARANGVRKRLVKGDAVQLGLYALAAREQGARDIAVSLVSPPLDLDHPQLRIEDLIAPADFWDALYRMQESGVFGMLGPVRSDFSFANSYPLATLAIDEEVLQEKWALTHPALVDDEEDW